MSCAGPADRADHRRITELKRPGFDTPLACVHGPATVGSPDLARQQGRTCWSQLAYHPDGARGDQGNSDHRQARGNLPR